MARGLSRKQRMFIEEYLKCWNATQAALRAGYSQRTAYSIGSENLKKPEIAAEIGRRIEEAAMSANEVLQRLAAQARARLGDFLVVDEDAWKFDIEKLAQAEGLIKKIKSGQYGLEIELYDAQTALRTLGKYIGLDKQVIEIGWRKEIIELLKGGLLTPAQVKEEIGDELARELFESAGISLASSGEIEAAGDSRTDE